MIQKPPPEILERMTEIIKTSFRPNGSLIPCQNRDPEDKKFFLRNYLTFYSGEPTASIERLYRICENCTNRQNTYITTLKAKLGL